MAVARVEGLATLDQLDVLLERTSHDELLDMWVRMIEEAARRASDYADVAYEAGATVDLVNEGLAFVVRADEFTPSVLVDDERVKDATRGIYRARRDLLAARPSGPRIVPAVRRGRALPAIEARAVRVEPARRLELDDGAVLAALAQTAQEVGVPSRGLAAKAVAAVLAGGSAMEKNGTRIAHADVIEVGKILSRLSREGRVRRVSSPSDAHTTNRWAPIEGGCDDGQREGRTA